MKWARFGIAWINLMCVLVVCSLNVHGLKHHNNREVLLILQGIHRKCPRITKLFKLPGKSVMGQTMWGIIMGNTPNKHVPLIPEFKYVSTIHGNEVVGKELLLQLAETMCQESLQGNEFVNNLLETTRIHLVPILNPDGWDKATASNYRDRNIITGRTNFHGIDLNRNFPNMNNAMFQFEKTDNWTNNHLAHFGTMSDKIQPETKAIMKWISSIPFVLSGSLHGGALVANYPYDSSRSGKNRFEYTESPDDDVFRLVSLVYANANLKMTNSQCHKRDTLFPNGITNGAEWYSLVGGMQDYNYLATNCFEITFEVGCTKYPNANELDELWKDHKHSLFNFMWMVHIGIKGLVMDIRTNKPIKDAIIHVRKLINNRYNDIWHDITTNKHGDYYRLLTDGTYEIVVGKAGYATNTTVVNVYNDRYNNAQVVNFNLYPAQ